MLAHHEQSETTQTDIGWQNVYGRRTQQAGQALPRQHEFEQDLYGDLMNAVLAAILRSRFEGFRQDFIGGSVPGRR